MIDVIESEAAFRERTKSPEELYRRLLPHLGSWIELNYSASAHRTNFSRHVGIFEGMDANTGYHNSVELRVSGHDSKLYLDSDDTVISVRIGDYWKIIQPALSVDTGSRA